MTDFIMYKGTTQPITISVLDTDNTTPTDLSFATEASWVCVAYPPDAAPATVLEKTMSNGDIRINPGSDGDDDDVQNTIAFSILPNDDAELVVGFYAHEARIMFGPEEYVVYPYPPTPSNWATFEIIESLTRGAEPGHTDSLVSEMPPVNLTAPAIPRHEPPKAPSYKNKFRG